ncbi:hypothetical protein KBY48_03080 [Streptomyces sp. RT42]|nr:hypothetical protein [Streptomyces sp. RT42]
MQRRGARIGQCLPQERQDAALQQGVVPGVPRPGHLLVEFAVEGGFGEGAVAQCGEQQAHGGDEDRHRGHGAEHPPGGEHGLREGLPRVEHLQEVTDEQEDRRGGTCQDGCQDGDDGDGPRAGRLGDLAHGGGEARPARALLLGAGPARGRCPVGRRRVAQFLADLDVVLVLGGGRPGDQSGGVERHGAQLFGVEPPSDGGQLRAVWCGAQRLVEEPLVLLAVLVRQVLRNAVHVHPPMLRRAWGSHANEPSGRNGGEPATDKPMVER